MADKVFATSEFRGRFDYEHGGVKTAFDADFIVRRLMEFGVAAETENSGDLYRVYVAATMEYFWPENGSNEAWLVEAHV